jgi:hypothetical protein
VLVNDSIVSSLTELDGGAEKKFGVDIQAASRPAIYPGANENIGFF